MTQALAAGTLLNGRFQIRRLLSESALGAVYLVDDVKVTEKPFVAREYLPLPVPKEERLAIEEAFQKQLEMVKTLSHPNLLRILDAFLEGNRNYLVTEYVDGLSLEAVLNLSPNPLSEEQVLQWAVQICECLEYLHGLPTPYYMKDLSPRYILVDRDGQVKVGGYGLDLIFSQPKKIPSRCLSPELCQTGEVTAAGDFYSLGACLYMLLTRREPVAPLTSVRQANIQASEKTSELIMTCLSEDPSRRPTNALELQEKFLRILHPPQEAPPPKPRPSLRDLYAKTVRGLAGGLAALVGWGVELVRRPYYLVLLALVLAALYYTSESRHSRGFVKTGPLAYVLCGEELVAVDLLQNKPVARLSRQESGISLAFFPDTKEMWEVSKHGIITRLDPSTGLTLGRFSLGKEIGGLAPGPRGTILVTLVQDNTLAAVASATGLPVAISPVGRQPAEVAYNPVENEAYVANQAGKSMTVVDTLKYLVKQTLNFDDPPSHLALSPDGAHLYVVYDDDRRLETYETKTKTLKSSTLLESRGPYAVSAEAQGILISAHRGNEILVLDPETRVKKSALPLDRVKRARFWPAENRVLASSDSGYLFVLDLQTGQIVQPIKAGKSPTDVIFVP